MRKVKPQEEDESQLKNTAGSTRSHGREQWPHTLPLNDSSFTPPPDFPEGAAREQADAREHAAAIASSKTPGSTPKKRTLSQLVRSVKLSPSRPPKRSAVSSMGAGCAHPESDMELGSSTADAEEPAAAAAGGAGSSSRRPSLPLARERSAQGYELDCYPYSFSPLLLFAQAQR